MNDARAPDVSRVHREAAGLEGRVRDVANPGAPPTVLSGHLAPITAEDALQMLTATRSYALLKGARGQRGVDVAIDCVCRGGSLDHCANIARNAGRVVITGIPSETHISFEYHPIRRKELAVLTVRRSNHDSEMALELLKDQPQRFSPIVTHFRPLAEVQSTLSTLERYADGVGKAVINVAG